MPENALSLMAILQRHGVTREVLEFWVHVLESRTNGSLTFHHNDQGYLGKCELRLAGQPGDMESSLRLTNLLTSPILRQNCRSS